ncbi:Rhs family protein [Aquitalea magnusonii]|uniref:Rhs family protein n=1 Tax=Aquitalea magnusonii TaxID=332411 RepID=A0A3G9GEC7_9NEIS|nr:RHS repeat-associated core domain-containing protein [Aquitalea magnusonii]BBF86230.1 Rhs family protein [Aquitalea magnusonii]
MLNYPSSDSTEYRYDPLAQVHTDAIQGVKVPAWNQHNPYDPERDLLLQAGPEPSAPRAVYYYHADHLGTPQALTDAQGQLALEMDYQAWGEAREVIAEAAASAGIRNPFRFQGQYHDDESGLHYNRYRYYDPEIGRFISRDPIGLLGGINIHSYTLNPITWIDPLGLSECPNKKTSFNAKSRREALRQAKRDARIPMNQQPKIMREDLEDGRRS